MLFPDITATVGRTPLVRLRRIIPPDHATVLLKLEFFNPLSSVKDRIGCAMLEAAISEGRVHHETHIVEPTSGNTGIALAFAAAARGLRLTLVMPETMSLERRQLLSALGAEIVLTPGALGMRGAIDRATEMTSSNSDMWMPAQFENPVNPKTHELTTGPEIWNDTLNNLEVRHLDAFVAGIGTGGTFTGVMRFLRRQCGANCCEAVRGIAVEPADSSVLSGGTAGQHAIQGIGAGFVPKNLDTTLIDQIELVTKDEAFTWARRLACEEGILVGISSGATVAVAARLAAQSAFHGKTIVAIAASSGERYLSTELFGHSQTQET